MLYQIVRNAATKARPRAELAIDQVEIAGESLEDTVLRRATAFAAISELERLPERQRGALVATALGDRAHAEVALSMGISEQAVRQLVHRARATLRRAVTGVTPWPLAKWLTTAPSSANGPEIAVGAGAVSSTGVAVKLGVLFAATGVLATGVAIGPGHQVNLEGVGQAAVTHGPQATPRDVARSSRPDSVEAAKMPQAWPKAAATRPGRGSRSKGPAAPSGATRETSLTAVTSTNAGAAAAEDLTAERHGDASAPERQATGSPENERQAAASSSDGTGSSSHDGQTASGSTVRAGSGSDGSQSGTVGTSHPEARTSGGDVATSDGGTSSHSDGTGGVTPAASSAFAADTSAARGDSDRRSRTSDGGERAQPGSGSDSTVSDTSPKGK